MSRYASIPVRVSRNASGVILCRVCKVPVPKGRFIYCSEECQETWRLMSDPDYLLRRVYERDRGVCAACGCDTDRKLKELNALPPFERAKRKRELGITGRRRLWEAHHLIPVVCGGGACGLENLQTLCVVHHRKETAKLAAWRAGQGKRECIVPFWGGGF